MDANVCPSIRDNEWLISTNSPPIGPTFVQGKSVGFRTSRFGRDSIRAAISRLPGFGGSDRIAISVAAYGARVTQAT